MEFHILSDEDKKDKMKFYRYTSRASSYDWAGVTIIEEVFYLEKETPCGYWITDRYGYDRRWVSKTTRKRYAYPDKDQALNSLYHRKKRQVKIVEAQLRVAKETIAQIDRVKADDEKDFVFEKYC